MLHVTCIKLLYKMCETMFQRHVAMINNSWQETHALEIQIFCSGIILKYWQRPHGHQLSRLDLGIICQILLSQSQDLNPTTLRHHQASPPSSCNRKMSDHQMCGISRESSNTSSRSEPAAQRGQFSIRFLPQLHFRNDLSTAQAEFR